MRSFFTLVGLIIIVAITLGLSQLSGTTSIEIDDNVVTLSTGVLCILIFMGFLVAYILLRFVAFLLSVPGRLLSSSITHFPQVLSDAFVELAAGDPTKAGRSIRKLEKIDSKFALLPLLKAKQAKLNGDLEGESYYLDQLINDPRAALLGFQETYRRAEHENQTRQAYEIALKAHEAAPKKPWSNHALVVSLANLGMWAAARDQLRKGWKYLDWSRSQKGQLEVALLVEEAQALWARDEKNEGYKLIKSAYGKDPYGLPVAIVMATYSADREDYYRLNKIMKSMWSKTPHVDFIQCVEGSRMAPGQKIKLWQKMIELNPTHPLSHFGLLSCLVNQKAFGRAKEHLGDIDPTYHNALYYQLCAKIHEGLGEDLLAARYKTLSKEAPKVEPWECQTCHNSFATWSCQCPSCKTLASMRGVFPTLASVHALDYRG